MDNRLVCCYCMNACLSVILVWMTVFLSVILVWMLVCLSVILVGSRFKVQGSLLFVTYTIIQSIISSEM